MDLDIELEQARKALNARQRKFAENIVKGMSGVEAQVMAGYNKNYGNASKLKSKEKVKLYIELLKKGIEAQFIEKQRMLTAKAYEKYDLLLDHGRQEDVVKANVAKDILSRSWLKPAEEHKHEHSGSIDHNVTLERIIERARQRKREADDADNDSGSGS
jgi:phage terminase small subunit